MKKTKYKTIGITDAIFFPEDFIKLPKGCVISIDKGKIMAPVKEGKDELHTRNTRRKKSQK